MPVEFLNHGGKFPSSSADTYQDVPKTKEKGEKAIMQDKILKTQCKHDEMVYTEGSKSVPIPAEVVKQLRDFLLSLPRDMERSLKSE